MDFLNFIWILKKRIWMLLLMPAVAMVTVIMLTQNIPKVYETHAMLSMGLTGTSISLQDRVERFTLMTQTRNMLELANSRTVMQLVGMHLLYHDLTAEEPFRQPVENQKKRSAAQVQEVREILKGMLIDKKIAALTDTQFHLINEFLAERRYDPRNLRSHFRIFQIGESDFLNFIFNAEHPLLVAFTLNSMAIVFIDKYRELMAGEKIRSREFFEFQTELALKKLHQREDEYEKFKEENNIVILTEQLSNLVAKINRFETLLDETRQSAASSKAMIWKIESQLSTADQVLNVSNLILLNTDVINLTNDIKKLEADYVKKRYERNQSNLTQIERQLRMKQDQLNELIHQLWLGQFIDPQISRQELATQLIDARIELEITSAKQKVIEQELIKLQEQSTYLAPLESKSTRLSREVEFAEQEYIKMLDKLNLARAEESNTLSSNHLQILEKAEVPLKPQASKRLMMVAVAGIGSVFLVIVTIFIIEYLDTSIRYVPQAEKATGSEVISGIPRISMSSGRVIDILRHPKIAERVILGESIRRLRNHVFFSAMKNKSIIITSSNAGEGKSIVASLLGTFFSFIDAKVLVVDGNFRTPVLHQLFNLKPRFVVQQVLSGKVPLTTAIQQTAIPRLDVLCSKPVLKSPLEISSHRRLVQMLNEMKDKYDYVIFDSSAMNSASDTVELIHEMDFCIHLMKSGEKFDDAGKRNLDMIKHTSTLLLGIVLNQMPLNYLRAFYGNHKSHHARKRRDSPMPRPKAGVANRTPEKAFIDFEFLTKKDGLQ